MDFSIGQQLSVKQTQELTISSSQIQSLNILAAPLMELQVLVNKQLEENPVLELTSPSNEESLEFTSEKILNEMNLIESYSGSSEMVYQSTDQQSKRQHFFDSLTLEISLHEKLLQQLPFLDLSDELLSLTKKIILDIDERGFLTTSAEALASENDTCLKLTKQAMDTIKTLEPSGVGCVDLRDRLLTQLVQSGKKASLAYKVLDRHFENLGANRLPLICSDLKVSMELLNQAIAEIKELSPTIVQVETNEGEYISEDIEVMVRGEEISFTVLQKRIPKVSINPKYQQMLKDTSLSKPDRQFIKEKLNSAVELMQQLVNRKTTMELVVAEIIKTQRNYFFQGIEALVPQTMKQVAEAIDRHETTVSRTIASKYLKSSFGLVPLKIFFSAGSSFESSETDTTGAAVKCKIGSIIDEENKLKPLSDAKIAKLLEADGIKIARRTVAKYRESLGIQATSLRRLYG
ncbi:MAG: RNA polymerase factor sigma-54 [Lentisphaeria bacterium]|nr:RNA polymerase factor sigma-54 [Lentisphaeria bacterium]